MQCLAQLAYAAAAAVMSAERASLFVWTLASHSPHSSSGLNSAAAAARGEGQGRV